MTGRDDFSHSKADCPRVVTRKVIVWSALEEEINAVAREAPDFLSNDTKMSAFASIQDPSCNDHTSNARRGAAAIDCPVVRGSEETILARKDAGNEIARSPVTFN